MTIIENSKVNCLKIFWISLQQHLSVESWITKESNVLELRKFQHHLDGLGKGDLSWTNSITMHDLRKSFGGPHQLYLFPKEITIVLWIMVLDHLRKFLSILEYSHLPIRGFIKGFLIRLFSLLILKKYTIMLT